MISGDDTEVYFLKSEDDPAFPLYGEEVYMLAIGRTKSKTPKSQTTFRIKPEQVPGNLRNHQRHGLVRDPVVCCRGCVETILCCPPTALADQRCKQSQSL